MALVLLVCVLAVLIVAPGYLILAVVRIDGSWTSLERAAIAFTLGLALLSLLAWLFYITGLGLEMLTYSLAGLGGFAILAGALRSGHTLWRLREVPDALARPWLGMGVLGFAVACAGLAAWSGPWLSDTADSFWHLAAIRSLDATGRPLVDEAIYASGHEGIDPLGTSWHTALAATAVLTDTDPVSLWKAAVPVSTVVLIVSFYVFAGSILRDRRAAILATLAHFVLFMNLDFRFAAQPNTLGFAALWVTLALLIRSQDPLRPALAALLAFLGAMLAALHFFLFEVFLLQAGGYLVVAWAVSWWRGSGEDYRLKALVIGAAAMMGAGIFFAQSLGTDLLSLSWQGGGTWLSGNWPTLGEIGERFWSILPIPGAALGDLPPFTWLDDLHVLRPSWVFVSPLHILAFAAVIVLLRGALKGERPAQFLTATTLAVPLLTLNPLIVSLLFERVTDIPIARLPRVAPLSLVLVAAGYQVTPYLLRQWNDLRNHGSVWVIALAGATGALAMAVSVVVTLRAVDGLGSTYFDSSDRHSVLTSRRNQLNAGEGIFRYLRERVDSDAVILSDQVLSYYVAGLSGQPVVYVKKLHWPGNVSTEENLIRFGVVDTIFPTPPSDIHDLYDVLMSWQVDYLLVDEGTWPDWELPEGGHRLLESVFTYDDMVLYEVTRSPPLKAQDAWEARKGAAETAGADS